MAVDMKYSYGLQLVWIHRAQPNGEASAVFATLDLEGCAVVHHDRSHVSYLRMSLKLRLLATETVIANRYHPDNVVFLHGVRSGLRPHGQRPRRAAQPVRKGGRSTGCEARNASQRVVREHCEATVRL